jgi:pSer/pThr/pTyr-binding forkhead associated (FHA) protein
MLCPVCRSDVPDTFEFCDQCGSRLRQAAAQSPFGQPAPQPNFQAKPASLVALSGRRYPISKADVLIGRYDPSSPQRPDIDLSPDDPNRTVSRRHARVIQREGRYLLQVEPTARNPGEMNGAKLQQNVTIPLSPGDRFQLGKVDLTFES